MNQQTNTSVVATDTELPVTARRVLVAEDEAFRWIQRSAMDRRTTMKVVAQAILNSLS